MITAIIQVKIITMNPKEEVIKNGYILMEEKILEVGSMEEFSPQEAWEIIDGQGGILMPGMINTHTHLPMIPFRGLGDDCVDRLRKFLIPMENRWMSKALVRASARYAIAESLLSGVTTVVDMYYFEDEVLKAADELGIRGFFGASLMEEATCDAKTPSEALLELTKLLEKWKNHKRVKPCVAPHGTTTCSQKTLEEAAALSKRYNTLLTLHVAEMDYEMSYFKNQNKTPIQYLEEIGVLSEHTLAGHCIHLTENDIQILHDTSTSVAHCIGSNTKAAKGVAPITKLKKQNVKIGLGTDGPASGNTLDLFTQFKLFADFHKTELRDRSAWPTKDIIALGTREGAKAIGIDDIVGSIEIGKQADLVLLETHSVNMFPVYDPCSTVVYSANASNVDSVWISGKQLVKEKQLIQNNLLTLRKELESVMRDTEFQWI